MLRTQSTNAQRILSSTVCRFASRDLGAPIPKWTKECTKLFPKRSINDPFSCFSVRKSSSYIYSRTKIVCTLGPSSDTKDRVDALVEKGMAVARLNFSHAGDDYSYPEHCMNLVRSAPGVHMKIASLAEGATVSNVRAVLVDTKGPEIRTGPLPGNEPELQIHSGQIVEIYTDKQAVIDATVPKDPTDIFKLSVDYMSIGKTVKLGGQVLLDDGLVALEVVSVEGDYVVTKALNGGPMKKNKGVNLPGVTLDLPALTEKDKRDLKWACTVGADYVAASFIRTPENVRNVIAFLDRCIAEIRVANPESEHLQLRPLVISKIESQEGVENFDEILKESDGIMVARGDLGVEIPFRKVFAEQKRMVTACNRAGKPVIVATQMLDSMIRNPRPTRAEVTDVGTAVLDGTDAVMLSGETAAGKYPLESIWAMSVVASEADQIIDASWDSEKYSMSPELRKNMDSMDRELDAVAASGCRAAQEMDAKLIIVITMSGRVARAVARHRPTVPVLAFCTDIQVARRLQLHRSIFPITLRTTLDPSSNKTRMGDLRAEAIRTAKELGLAKAGDCIVCVDRTLAKPGDLHDFAHNMKIVKIV